MDCPICRNLQQAYDFGLREYTEARSSACFLVSKKFAAVKNVDMERARFELAEHRTRCVFAVRVLAPFSELDSSAGLKPLAA
jgi:hypothetical protein